MNKYFYTSLVAALLFMPKPAFAAPLFNQIKNISHNIGESAQKKEDDLKENLKKAEARARQEVADKLKDLENSLREIERNINQDLIDGKARIVQALACTVTNSMNQAHVIGSAAIDLNKGPQKKLLNLAKLYPNDPAKEHLALSFSGTLDVRSLRFNLVDINENRIISSGNLAELGLGELKEKCELKQNIVYLNDGKVAINTEDNLPKVLDKTFQAIKNGGKDVANAVAGK